jgi:hypothetical protein
VKSPKDFESWYQRLIDANPEVSQGAENEFMTKLGQGQAMLDAGFALADAIAAIVSLRSPNTGSKLGIIPGGGFDGKGKGGKISEPPPIKSKIDTKPLPKSTLPETLKGLEDVGGEGAGDITPPKPTKPNQVHHYATNKSKKYTHQMEAITKKYGLDLDEDWNKELLPHQGRHPNDYHEYVLDNLNTFDMLAKGDKDKFLKLYEQLKKEVRENPDMLYKNYWRDK